MAVDYNRSESIQHFYTEIAAGNLEFSDIENHLSEQGIDQDEINIVARIVDNKLKSKAVTQTSNKLSKNLIAGGLLFLAVGLLVSLVSFLRVVDIGGYYIVAIGPIAIGLLMVAIGMTQMRK